MHTALMDRLAIFNVVSGNVNPTALVSRIGMDHAKWSEILVDMSLFLICMGQL